MNMTNIDSIPVKMREMISPIIAIPEGPPTGIFLILGIAGGGEDTNVFVGR